AFIFAIVAAIGVWFILRYTLKGFEIVVLGQSDRAGRFAGFSSKKMIWFSFLFSGALAGCRWPIEPETSAIPARPA
ncbi:ABC transporter permease, partial [Rhizobium ruizarguesonis]